MGDPLIATTHTDLLLRCKENNIEFKIYNNISILNLIGKTGLQLYKFGKITSIPFFNEKFMPITPLKVLEENLSIKAHTLFLLDLNPSKDDALKSDKIFLSVEESLNFLIHIQKKENKDLFNLKSKIFVCLKLGFSDEKIIFESIGDILKRRDLNKYPCCLIFPSTMDEIEGKFFLYE